MVVQHNAGAGERVSFADASRAQRQANARAIAVGSDLSRGDLRVLANVLDATTSYSKLADRVRQADLARGVSVRQARRSLARLAGCGIIVQIPGLGAGNLSVVGVPPRGTKADDYLAALREANQSAFPAAETAEKGTESGVKADTQRARVKNEKREVEAEALTEEERFELEPSRNYDHVVGEGAREPEQPPMFVAPPLKKRGPDWA